jgi:hypothetical protein
MKTPVIGTIHPIPQQSPADTNEGSVFFNNRAPRHPGKASGRFTAFKDDEVVAHEAAAPGVELLLHLAVQPVSASARLLGPGGFDRTLLSATSLLENMARHDSDPVIAQACDLLREDTMLRALASRYRNALQAG